MKGSGLSPFPLKQRRHCYFKLPVFRAQHWVGVGGGGKETARTVERERNSSKLPRAILHGAHLCIPPAFSLAAGGKGSDAGLNWH